MTIRRLGLAGLAMIAACSRQVPRADGPNVVTITTSEYAFGMPDTIPAGLRPSASSIRGRSCIMRPWSGCVMGRPWRTSRRRSRPR